MKPLKKANPKTTMAEPRNGNGNGSAAAVGVVLGILAIIAGVYAMISPMNLRIDQLQTQLAAVLVQMEKGNERERDDTRAFASMEERFKVIETQFRAASDLTNSRDEDANRRLEKMEEEGNQRHDERIKTLERIILHHKK